MLRHYAPGFMTVKILLNLHKKVTYIFWELAPSVYILTYGFIRTILYLLQHAILQRETPKHSSSHPQT